LPELSFVVLSFTPQEANKALVHMVSANAEMMIFFFNIACAPYSSLCANLILSG